MNLRKQQMRCCEDALRKFRRPAYASEVAREVQLPVLVAAAAMRRSSQVGWESRKISPSKELQVYFFRSWPEEVKQQRGQVNLTPQMQRLLSALKSFGRPATALEITERSGICRAKVCTLLSSSLRNGEGLLTRSGERGKYLYRLVAQCEELPSAPPVVRREATPPEPRETVAEMSPEERRWHVRKIKEYGLLRWARVVNREPEELEELAAKTA